MSFKQQGNALLLFLVVIFLMAASIIGYLYMTEKESLTKIQRQLSRSEKAVKRIERNYQQEKDINRKLSQDFNQRYDDIRDLQNEINLLSSKEITLKQEMEKLRAQLKIVREEKKRHSQNDRDQLLRQIDEMQMSLGSEQQRCNGLEKEMIEFRKGANAEVNTLNQSLEELKRTTNQACSESTLSLQQQLASEQQQHRHLLQQVEESRDENSTLLSEQSLKLQSIKADSDLAIQENSRLKSEFYLCQERELTLQKELTTLGLKITIEKDKNFGLARQLVELEKTHNSCLSKAEGLHQEIELKDKSNKELLLEFESSTVKTREVETEHQETLKHFKTENAELSQDKEKLTEKNRQLNDQLITLQLQIDQWNQQRNSDLEVRGKMESDLKRLRDQRGVEIARVEVLEAEYSAALMNLRAENALLSDDNERLTEKSRQLNVRLISQQQQIEQWNQQKNSDLEVRVQMESDLKRLQDQYFAVKGELEALIGEHSKLLGRVGEVIDQNQQLLTQAEQFKTEATILTFSRHELFHPGSTQLNAKGQEYLSGVAKRLTDYPGYRIRVIGHTDSLPLGSKMKKRFHSNWDLSAARAAATIIYLQYSHQIQPERIELVGMGSYAPIADNSTQEGRALNRRIELQLIPPSLPLILVPSE